VLFEVEALRAWRFRGLVVDGVNIGTPSSFKPAFRGLVTILEAGNIRG